MSKLYAPIPGLNEAIAARNEALAEQEQPSPLVPGWLTVVATTLVPVLVAASSILPHPLSAGAGILALVSAFLAGVPRPSPSFSRPLIPLTLVPLALSVGGGLATFAASLTTPLWQGVAMLGASVCFAVAGKTLPAPKR